LKKYFASFLLVVNAFLISYAYGLNSCRVKVVDHSLPPLEAKRVKPETSGQVKKATTDASAKGFKSGDSSMNFATAKHAAVKHSSHAAKKGT
jgi:hypothetical protein